jgi:hypothetical protein
MLRIYWFKYLFFLLLGKILIQCQNPSTVLERALETPIPEIQEILENKQKHEIQILLTQVERTHSGAIKFQESAFQVDENQYFYPASTAKLPVAVLALQKLKTLQAQGVQINGETPFLIKNKNGETIIEKDSTHHEGKVTLHHLIKKIFLVSDNDAYNYLFDFLGRDYINKELKKRGLSNTQLHHKFLFGADNETTWHYTFLNAEQDTLYHQPSLRAKLKLEPHSLKGIQKGVGYLSAGTLVKEPMDFSEKNRISIRDLQGILQRIIFPEHFSKEEQFEISEENYSFLKDWMSRTTLESTSPNYNDGAHWDSYGKFLIYGDQKGAMTPEIRIFNKVGYAYGTLTDVAYIKEVASGLEFFLTATVLVNENAIFNDDQYEFETQGIPFLAALGRAVLEELKKG